MSTRKADRAPAAGIAQRCNGGIQQRRQREHAWTPARRETFLATLAQTCNVRLALSETGMSEAGLYYLRRRDELFAREWDSALEHGYALLEATLLQRAQEGYIREVMSPRGEVVKLREVSNKLGMNLLALHARRVAVIRAAREARPAIADEEELRRKVAETFDRLADHREWMGRHADKEPASSANRAD
ncbi:MAG: hypothetical protein K2Y17_02305 [Qipengyuania sp.]|nr:hypothetical protein [Qipengyuania sp.]